MGDDCFADAAWFVFSAINEKALFEIAGLSVGIEEIAESCSALCDGFREHFADRGDEFFGLWFGEFVGG